MKLRRQQESTIQLVGLRPDDAEGPGTKDHAIMPAEAGLVMICSLVTQLSIRILLRADSLGDFVRMLRVVLHRRISTFPSFFHLIGAFDK
jgi:hypothetical protein